MLRALACCAFAAGLLRACRLGAFRSLRASPGLSAPRIPPGRVMLSMRCWLALESTGLGLGWVGLAVLAYMLHLDLVLVQACFQWHVPTEPNTERATFALLCS